MCVGLVVEKSRGATGTELGTSDTEIVGEEIFATRYYWRPALIGGLRVE